MTVLDRMADASIGHLGRRATARAAELTEQHGRPVVPETDPDTGDVRFVYAEQEEQ